MNKDVIYIEPEDDITDIITKIEKSKEKIVALVPPKKAGVFRSIVNIKLISKAATNAKKTVVLVTTDPSIIKLAAVTKLPVTKDLQSAPSIPDIETEIDEKAEADVENEDEPEEESESSDEDSADTDEKGEESPSEKGSNEKDDETKKEDDDKEADEDKKEIKEGKKKNKKPANKFIAWIVNHKKLSSAGACLSIALILLLVWMFVIAPAVSLTIDIITTLYPFRENVTFTTNLEEENIEEGKFHLDERKIESIEEKEFEATGEKNVGEKARGNVVVYAFFKDKGSVAINAGSTFSISGLTYVSEKDVTLSWDGNDVEVCDNKNSTAAQFKRSGCQISDRINVVATAPGSNHNIAASNAGWRTTANIGVYSDSAMTGGTDEMITVVSQADIDKARDEIDASNESENKEKLYELVGDTSMAIDSSFRQKISDPVSTPAVGEEVKSGEKATIKVTTTATIYAVDKAKVEEFIREKAKLEDNQKIYEVRSPFIENFIEAEGGFMGKLKTSYAVGPKITENDIIEVVKGKGLGEAQHDLRDIDGITSVKIDKSFPWVMSVPSDANKISIYLEIKE